MIHSRALVPKLLSVVLTALPLLAQGNGGAGGGAPPGLPDLVGLTRSGHRLQVTNAANGSSPRTVSNENFFRTFPTLSPDGQQIAFAMERNGQRAVWVIGSDGTGLRAVTPHAEPGWAPNLAIPIRVVWSPVQVGGQHMLLFQDRVGSIFHLFAVNLDGTGRTMLTGAEPNGVEPYRTTTEWSPDGTRIVYMTYDPSSWPGATIVADVDASGGALTITARMVLPLAGVVPSTIAWANRSDRLVLADSGGLGYDLWRIDLNPLTPPVRLTNTPSVEEHYPSFSSDDSKVFFKIAPGNETWFMNANGSGSRTRFSTKIYWCYHRRG